MCKRHSFLLNRAGKVLDGFGITDSHTEIRELHGLKNTDDSVNAYEWQPPKGWPETDWHLGLTKDHEVFTTKASHEKAMERHIRATYPDSAAWDAGDKPRITAEILRAAGWNELLPDGEYSSLAGNNFCTSGKVNSTGQTGGYCWGIDNATVNSTGQTGGDCRGYDNATVNSTGQTGGYCWGIGNATVNRG